MLTSPVDNRSEESRAGGAPAGILARLLHLRPRIENKNSCGLKISDIPCHDVEAVLKGGCGNQSVNGSYDAPGFLSPRGNLSPDTARFVIDRKQMLTITGFKRVQPNFERLLFATLCQKCDPFVFPERLSLNT